MLKSRKSDECAQRGDMAGAFENGKSAKKWATIAISVGVLLAVTVIIHTAVSFLDEDCWRKDKYIC